MRLNYIVQMMDADGEWADMAGFSFEAFACDYKTLLECDIPEREFRIVKRGSDGIDTTPVLGRQIH
jgi:hypothetical protein